MSIDGGFKVSLFITEWENLRRIHQFFLPTKNRTHIVSSTKVANDDKNNIFIIAENEFKGIMIIIIILFNIIQGDIEFQYGSLKMSILI